MLNMSGKVISYIFYIYLSGAKSWNWIPMQCLYNTEDNKINYDKKPQDII